MSKGKKITQRAAHVALWFSLLCTLACDDPCHRLGTQLCECKSTQEERETCKKALNLAKAHKFFDIAKDPSTCTKALEECGSCKQIAEGNDLKCGLYRTSL